MSQLQKLRIISTGFRYNLNSKTVSLLSSSSSHRSHQFKRLQATAQIIECSQQHTDWDRARSFKEIPTLSKLSMFLTFLPGGKYHNLDFVDFLQQIKQEYGNIFLMPGLFGKDSMIFLFDPDDFDKILYNAGPWPRRRPLEIIKHYREELRKDFYQNAQGLAHTQGEEWGTFRSAVNPVLMQPKTIKSYLPKLAKVNWELIQRIKEIRDPVTLEVPENFEEEINRYTLESVSVIALDKKLGLVRGNRDDPEVLKLFKDLRSMFRLLYYLEVKPSIWKYIRTPEYHQMVAALDGISNFVAKYVEEAVDRLENQPNGKFESEEGVLEKLLKINKKVAKVMVNDMLAAGVDTTTTTLMGVFLCLAKNQEKQQKLRDELRQVFPQKDTPFTEDGLKKLPYLRALIKECLRLYPIGPALPRTTNQNVVLSGYQVPKGLDVILISYFAKESSKYYVEGSKFLPERWLRKSKYDKADGVQGSTSSNPFVYLPFGFGPHMCIGRRIVDLELEVAVAGLVRNFNIEYNYPVEKVFKNHIINTPAIPLKFKFTDVMT